MKKTCISADWYFRIQGGKDGYRKVDLPYDYTVTMPRRPDARGRATNGFFDDANAFYVKYFAPEEMPAQHYILDLDGAYMCAEISVNDDWMAMHPHGYTPFLLDITRKVRPGHTNKIKIKTSGLQCSTRWYSGAGLYRDVFLWTGGDVRVEPWDVFVTTEEISEQSAALRVAYAIAADRDADVKVESIVRDARGKQLTRVTKTAKVKAGEKTPLSVAMTVKDPRLWDMDDPYLHTLETRLTVDGTVTDTAETTFGIRTISADTTHGFRLNGKTRKLRGGCIHHDHGVLGAAAYPAAEERKVTLLKEAGFNALRIAHNPPSLALVEVCDRLGIIVIDEAFDMWNNEKTEYDYHLWFGDWWARDVSYMILRDRNHPCVIAYSIGNEIEERDGHSDGAEWAAKIAAEMRRYDTTRFITSGICGCWRNPESIDPEDYRVDFMRGYKDTGNGSVDSTWGPRTENFMKPLDIVGYNYLYERYDADGKTYPDRVIWGSETHTLRFYRSWQEILRHPYVLGDFTWTAYDNLGEAGTGRSMWARDGYMPGISLAAWPWRNCYQGDLDLCGYRRPQSYFREAVWIGGTEPRIFTVHPEHYNEGFSGTGWHWYDVLDTWTFEDKYLGKPVTCHVYTDADEIEFILNGRSLGRIAPVEAIAKTDIPYEPGELVSVAYKDGQEVGRSSLHTVGTPAAVEVEAEKTVFRADGRDLCYFRITVTDENGDRVPDAGNLLTCVADGGELVGIFSGDPKNEEDRMGDAQCHAFTGRALAVVRTKEPGIVTLTVGHNGLRSGEATAIAE